MCGRYALALRPSQVRQMLEDEGMSVDTGPPDEGTESPRQTYNFAPGYQGLIYRADTPDYGASVTDRTSLGRITQLPVPKYKLQSMKWGLIPSWTKRNPNYGSLLNTINCRDDSLSAPGGLWGGIKGRKRCIVIAQGFFEWLKRGKTKLPHFVKRADGKLMCLAGLWDCVQYEDSETKQYTYTIITTDSNAQLKFLHNRMPVILDAGSEAVNTWLDPGRSQWTRDLQRLLTPFTGGLECYPVNTGVGKVGNNSASFVMPIASKENKSNIANYFSKPMSQEPSVTAHTDGLPPKGGPDSTVESPSLVNSPQVSAKRKQPMATGNGSPTKRAHHRISRPRNEEIGKSNVNTTSNRKITSFFTSMAQEPSKRHHISHGFAESSTVQTQQRIVNDEEG